MKTFTYLYLATFLAAISPISSAEDIQTVTVDCAVCHGPQGISSNSEWPHLAGQKVGYLTTELTAFRDGNRKDPIMSPAAQNLTDQQIASLAEYYAKQPAPTAAAANVNQEGRNIRANCLACHGVDGISIIQQWPNLAGQQKDYLAKQLKAFRDGTRYSPVMQVIAINLNDEQIEAVAEYYSQLPGR